MGIGLKIKELRERKHMTQEELASKLGVTPAAVGNYERSISHPKESVLLRIFEALDCEPNELFSDYYSADDTQQHLLKYRALDSHGKELVDTCTELEYRRVKAERSCCDNDVLIAARGGGSPHKMSMKKRKGMSLKAASAYKGVR